MKLFHGTSWLAGALLISSTCLAQVPQTATGKPDSSKETVSLEEIIITGSYIHGDKYSASPLRKFDENDIKDSGFANTDEFLNAQPSFFRGGVSEAGGGPAEGLVQTGPFTGSNSQFTNLAFASAANLHGVGNGSTLVLLDGMRIASTDGGSTTDLLGLPLGVMQQIDVLGDGASALYGSDAVGGVINFHLKKDYSGQETRLRYGLATDGGGTERQIDQTVGRNWGSGSFLVSGEYAERGFIDAQDRSFTRELPEKTYLLPASDRYSVLATARQEISSGIELTGTGLYSKRLVHSLTSNDVGPFLWTNDHHGNVEQYSLMGGGNMRLGDTWFSSLTLNYSGNDTSRRQVQDRGPLGQETFIDAEKTAVESADLNFDGTLFDLWGQSVKAAVGGHFREESFDAGGTADFSRHSKAAFGELLVPFAFDSQRDDSARVELSLAGRYEDYSDFGDTFDPKIGLVFAVPAVGVNLRSTWGTSRQVPRFPELYGPQMGLLFPIPNATGGTTLAAFAVGGNRNLKPEEAETFTAGFDVRSSDILPGFSASATYFDINNRHRIAPERALFDALLNRQYEGRISQTPDPALLQFLATQPDSFNPTGADWATAEVSVDNRYLNIASLKVRGVDVLLGYELSLNTSALNFTLDSTYLIDKTLQQSETSPSIDVSNEVDNPIDLRMRGGVAWRSGPWAVAGFVNYSDSYQDSRIPPVIPVSSWTTVDLNLRYELPFINRWTRGMQVSLIGHNVLNKDPPYIRDLDVSRRGGVHADIANVTLTGRTVAAEFTTSW